MREHVCLYKKAIKVSMLAVRKEQDSGGLIFLKVGLIYIVCYNNKFCYYVKLLLGLTVPSLSRSSLSALFCIISFYGDDIFICCVSSGIRLLLLEGR